MNNPQSEERTTPSSQSVALVVGVTGMAGLAIAEALKKPEALGGPWKVYGAARRPLPEWFSPSIVDGFISFDATDHDETRDKLSPVAGEVTHVFWVAIQVRSSEEENIAVNSTMLGNVLEALRSTPVSPLHHVALQTGTKHYIGPILDPALSNDIMSHEPPFREDLPRLPYPNFYYALEDLLVSYQPVITYSIHRSSIIVGASTRTIYNVILTVAVYAAICRHEGLPFRFPGTQYTWDHFCDMTDARVLAEQHVWAAATDGAKNQAFNCSNGDVFTWKSMWQLMCEVFRVEFVPFEESGEFDFLGMMEEKGKVWDEIVEKHGLRKTKLEEITCFPAVRTVFCLKLQLVCSMNKSRELGFFGFTDSFKSVRFWVERMRQLSILP